jgi:hypothetical protein
LPDSSGTNLPNKLGNYILNYASQPLTLLAMTKKGLLWVSLACHCEPFVFVILSEAKNLKMLRIGSTKQSRENSKLKMTEQK